MDWLKRAVCAMAMLAGLSACTTPMEYPKVAQRAPLDVGRDTADFMFAGGSSKIPLGTEVGTFPNIGSDVRELGCGRAGEGAIEWERRMAATWNGELGEVFYDTMKSAGYNVVGDPQRLFEHGEDRHARYAIGARLVDLKGNFCQEVNVWRQIATRRIKGEFYAKVEWEVYDVSARRLAKTFVSEGFGRQTTPAYEGAQQALQYAFGSAAANLGADPEFLAFLSADSPAVTEARASKAKDTDAEFALFGPKPSAKSMHDAIDVVLDGVVTVRQSTGHGSGFFISRDGYGVTNAHVVGEAETVTLRLRSGIEIEAKVLRRDKSRDVALFKAPIQVLRPLAVTPEARVARLDEVYAVGTPLDLGLESTVTRGVVSALRKVEERGRWFDYIQADVAISPGNSGGPLIDAKANVIGLTVSAYLFNGGTTGLNNFIPIGDGLKALHVTVTPEAR
jgi:serine protease Do